MIGKLIFFLVSLIAAGATGYFAVLLKTSSIRDKKMTGLYTLCLIVPFWIILSAVVPIVEAQFFPFAYTLKSSLINVIPYLTIWFFLHFIESKLIKSRFLRFYLIFMPALALISLFTNPCHMLHLVTYTNPPKVGYFFLVHIAFSLLSLFITYILLFSYVIKNFKNRPVLLLTGAGAIIPIIIYLLYLFIPVFKFDLTSIGYFFSIAIFVYSSYASRLKKAGSGIFTETLTKITKSREIISGTTLEAGRLISKKGCLTLDAFRVGVWSFNEKTQTLKNIACFNNITHQYSVLDDIDIHNLMQYKQLLLSEKIIAINDTRTNNFLSSANIYESNICSVMIAPVKLEDRLAGIIYIEQNINVSFTEKREWNPEEQQFASSLADLMAISFINEERQSLIKAESVSRAKSQFITNISHEIRTPMNAVLGMVEIAMRENDPDKKNEHLQIVKQSGVHLMSIISDILDFSKIESVKPEVVQEEYLITSLLDEIVNLTSMGIVGSKIRFAVKADNNIPKLLCGDETKIRQIVLNLLDNAIKYTEHGSVSLGVYGEIANNDTMNLIFTVSDTGIGIRPENMETLFNDREPYIESDHLLEGAGLGLAITKNFIDAMEGQIDVYSEFGKGSIFTVSVPQKYRSNTPMAQVSKPETQSVLIFERRDVYMESLAFTVKNLGSDCTIVSSGTELYERMENKKFDYLFISFGLYKKNEDTIRKFGPHTEVIILTEFDEVVSEKNLKTLTMPVYCTVIAEVLNGIYKNISYSAGNESAAMFTAPDARVLVVDDIKTNLKVAQGLLAPYNMRIDLCFNGSSAIEAIQSSRYDLVFMDHRMPGIDGVEATRRIREWEKSETNPRRDKPIPIVALTANAVLGIKDMFLKNGFNDFLPKPIDTVQLNEILENWIPKEKQVKA